MADISTERLFAVDPEGHHWANALRCWSHVVKYRTAAALAGSPCWRVFGRCMAARRGTSACSVAKDEALTVGSTAAIARRFTASTRTINLLAASWIRGPPPRCDDAEPFYCRHA